VKGIYAFLCKTNNKNIAKRFGEHIKGLKSNIRLQRSFNKYGLNNFYFFFILEY